MEFNKLILRRRSVRSFKKFKDENPVDSSVLKEILESTLLAPSWKNFQTGRYYVITSPEKLDEIKSTCLPPFNQKSCNGASALIVTSFVCDTAGFSDGTPDNELGNNWGAYDLGLQNAYLVLKASDMGFDTLIMGIRDEKELRARLDIPQNEIVAAVIALGIRDGDPVIRKRKDTAEIARFY